MAADNTILQANVELKIDTTTVDKQIKDASKKLETGLKKTDNALSKQLSRQIKSDLDKVGKTLERASEGLARIFEKGLKLSLGVGTSAVFAFLKNGTPEAKRFADSLDKLKVAWSKVGQTLATKINFGGKTGQEWVDAFTKKIENLNISQIQKALDIVREMAKYWLTFKTLSLSIKGIEAFSKIESLISNLGKQSSVGNISNAATNLAGGLVSAAVVKNILPSANMLEHKRKLFEDPFYYTGKKVTERRLARSMREQSNRKFNNPHEWIGWDPKPGESLPSAIRRMHVARTPIGDEEKAFVKSIAPFNRSGFQISDINQRNEKIARGQRLYNAWKGPSLMQRMAPARGTYYGSVGVGAATAALGVGIDAIDKYALGNKKVDMRRSVSNAAFSTGGTALGAMIGTAILPGIGTMVGASIGYLTSSQFYQRVLDVVPSETESKQTGKENAERMAKLLKRNIALGGPEGIKVIEESQNSMYARTSGALNRSQVYREYISDQRSQYAGGKLPAFKLSTTNIVKNVQDKVDELTALESEMLSQWNSFSDEEKAFRTTFKDQLDKITLEKNAYLKEQEDQVNIWKEAKKKEKDFNEKLKEFDYAALNAYTAYQNNLTDINKNKDILTPYQSSISMGGDITAIPSLISQALNDTKNKESEKLTENFQKMIDTELASLQYQMDLVNITAEKNKFEKETKEQDREDRKTIKENLIEIRKAVGGSSTVTQQK